MEIKAYTGKKELPIRVTWGRRPDVGYAYHNDPAKSEFGIFIQADVKGSETVRFVSSEIEDGEAVHSETVVLRLPLLRYRKRYKAIRADLHEKKKLLNHYLRRDYHAYTFWFINMRVTPMELEEQRNTHFPYEPLISILVPVYRPKTQYLREMLSSVCRQSYGNWELILVNADPSDPGTKEELLLFEQADSRIHVTDLPENGGISKNTNAAMQLASGEFCAMLDHDDVLEYDTLYEYVRFLNEKPETDLLYCDEDKIRDKTDYFYYPNFKPDFNPDLLFCNNYICHFLMVRRSLALSLGGYDSSFDGAQDYDFILRVTEKTKAIGHVPKVLYHWRSAASSTAKKNSNKDYASDAGARAINASYLRRGIPAEAAPSPIGGWYISKYRLTRDHLVSVLIPNKDHTDDLDTCLRSLKEKCTYKNLEIIVIENNSTEDRTFRYYEEMQERWPDIMLLHYEGGFNYSRINNFGFRHAKGDLVMLLNNDTEVITEDLFESMIGYIERDEVGMVGARLLFADDTVQHAGVLTGAGGLADHMFKGLKDSKPGYMCRSVTTMDVSAVTAACMLVKRSVYEEVGGLDESLAEAFNDVDFCMKVRSAGYLIVYDAQAKMHHYESKSRGSENTPEKFSRFSGEAARINEKWHILVDYVDPYYNPNMSYLDYFKPDERTMLLREKRTREIYRDEM